jgi:AmiR/NasT family two-component response regulator
MREMGISENEAFKKIQKYSMDNRKSMREIAEAIIMSNEMKKI